MTFKKCPPMNFDKACWATSNTILMSFFSMCRERTGDAVHAEMLLQDLIISLLCHLGNVYRQDTPHKVDDFRV